MITRSQQPGASTPLTASSPLGRRGLAARRLRRGRWTRSRRTAQPCGARNGLRRASHRTSGRSPHRRASDGATCRRPRAPQLLGVRAADGNEGDVVFPHDRSGCGRAGGRTGPRGAGQNLRGGPGESPSRLVRQSPRFAARPRARPPTRAAGADCLTSELSGTLVLACDFREDANHGGFGRGWDAFWTAGQQDAPGGSGLPQ